MVIAALVAAAGLGIQAVSSIKSNALADDQLSQSEKQQREKERSQIALINFWGEAGRWPVDDLLVVVNRSLDPAHIWIYLDFNGHPDSGYYSLGVLPPCKRLEMDFPQKGAAPWPIRKLLVVDSTGRAWVRTPGGRLNESTAPTTVPETVTEMRPSRGLIPTLVDLDQCASSSG
ncbi:putative secreted protein (plasmid) [Streptomyces glaucescens]|uniref:Putative secreted protein n=2 Tax=Streptomyces glaucescens TaxID=1907 RepID=A0A089Z9P9_STRGA|nr:putative secreted protein [Streptomyces glaucescens]